MASFSCININEYDFNTKIKNVCICCALKSDTLLRIASCKHTDFFMKHVKYQIDIKNSFVCLVCHAMLKKIEAFKQQIEDSIDMLLDQTHQLKITKLLDLQTTAIQTYTNLDTLEPIADSEVKAEDSTEPPTLQTEIKIEHDSNECLNFTDDEAEVPLSVFKKKKKTKESKVQFEGKIQHIQLTIAQLMEEREVMKLNEGYLKLPYKCEDCIVGFDHELTLQSHMNKRHKKTKKSHQCDICKSILSTKFSFDEHMRRHVRRVECMVCGRRYNHIQSAIQHYDEKHAAPPDRIQPDYVCKSCGFTTQSNRVYRYHMDKHRNQGCECKICGNTFVNLNGLRAHLYTVHSQSSRVYKCEPCNKMYRAKSGLAAHVKSVHEHEPGRAFCALCRTQYRNEKTLMHHLNTHSNHITDSDKKYICDECGMKFVKKNDLKIHINWEHLKINTHSCTKCTKIFRSNTALRRHFNYVHLKQRPPRDKICDYCGRGFTTQTILQSHIRTHTGERPLQCSHCPATFAHSAALYTHNKLLHNSQK